ncbi:transcription factor-like 5 protein [Lampris incognitus]|uniref:transcription factor-like 5 protein n=1 Tax=Lampris incognitus TaxID=2546036 RepID=UPI0024B5BC4C|nr:transcription factor-like 5 protein [Lampris incognitus]
MSSFSAVLQTIHDGPPKEYSCDSTRVIASPSGCVTQDQGHNLGAEVSLMEMTELEYTRLQHISQTHMDAQAADSYESDAKFHPTLFGFGSLYTQPATSICDDAESVVISSSPIIQVIDLSTSNDEQAATSNASQQETVDIQELKRILVGNEGTAGEKTPTICGEVPTSVLARVKSEAIVSHAEVPASGSASSLTRSHPSARVCLEKRFNCMPCNIPKEQDTQSTVLSNFLTMLQQSTEAQEAAIPPQMQKLMRLDRTDPVELSNPFGGGMFNPITAMCGQLKALGHIPHAVEPNEHQRLIIPRNFSFSCHNPESFATKAQCISCTDPVGEQQRVKGENVPPLKHVRAQGSQNFLESKGTVGEAGITTRKKAGHPMENSQRRERHNNKERDRRRRIRQCCDELNMLVPFCNKDTDKATTLQWTTAFVKYVKEDYGDSIKREFESTFCVRTGLRLKPHATLGEAPADQEMAETEAPLAVEQ